MAFKLKLAKIFLGAAYRQSFKLFSKSISGVKTPIDLSGMNGRIQLRERGSEDPRSSPILADWSTTHVPPNLTLNANTITINLTRTETEAYNFDEADWDLLIWPGSTLDMAEVVAVGFVDAERTNTDID